MACALPVSRSLMPAGGGGETVGQKVGGGLLALRQVSSDPQLDATVTTLHRTTKASTWRPSPRHCMAHQIISLYALCRRAHSLHGLRQAARDAAGKMGLELEPVVAAPDLPARATSPGGRGAAGQPAANGV